MNTITNTISTPDFMSAMSVQNSNTQLYELIRLAVSDVLQNTGTPAHVTQAVGITSLATELGCSVSFLYTLKAEHVLDPAIISHIGKKVVFNVDIARKLANEYQANRRAARENE